MEMVGKWLLTCTVPSTADGDKQWPLGGKTYPSACATAHALDQGCLSRPNNCDQWSRLRASAWSNGEILLQSGGFRHGRDCRGRGTAAGTAESAALSATDEGCQVFSHRLSSAA